MVAAFINWFIITFHDKWVIDQERQEFREEVRQADLPKKNWYGWECIKQDGKTVCRKIGYKKRKGGDK
jgi:hypothetical protein